jgi:hypothetical protein
VVCVGGGVATSNDGPSQRDVQGEELSELVTVDQA